MKAIYSYWDINKLSKSSRNWINEEYKWMTLALSVCHSLNHFNKVEMVTTSECKKIIEDLKIPFTKITTELDDLDRSFSKIWILEKIKAYSIQEEPFIHIDGDFILYQGPGDFKEILVQEVEDFSNEFFRSGYENRLERCRKNFVSSSETFMTLNNSLCMGVYGQKNLELNKKYCETVLKTIEDNKEYLKKQADLSAFCIVLEQYILAVVSKENEAEISEIRSKFLHLTSEKFVGNNQENIEKQLKEENYELFKRIKNAYI